MGNTKKKKCNYSFPNLDVISSVSFPQASEPSLNLNISKMAYWSPVF